MRLPAEQFRDNPMSEKSLAAQNRQPSVAQMMARMAVHRALYGGNFDAFEDIIDRIEGKATQAPANKPNNNALNEQIDGALTDLNKLTEG